MDVRPPRKSVPPSQPLETLPAPQIPADSASVPAPGSSDPSQPEPAKDEKTFRGRKVLWWSLGILGAILVLIGGAVGWYAIGLSPADKKDNTRQLVVLQPGVTASEVAALLQEKGLIRDKTAFRTYVEIRGVKEKLQAGAYKFSRSQSVVQIVGDLVLGKTEAYNVTILPGQTLAQIKQTLERAGFRSADIDAAFAKKYDHPVLASKPEGVSLEGYIYPETYQVDGSTTAESLVVRSLDQFQKVLQENNLPARLASRGLSLHSGITLASIIQKEVKQPEDQKKVSQVFQKRLSIGMELGSDVTFQYAARLMNVAPSVDLDSPYNTRRYKGLPPGAISNFNLSALEAVADPAPTDYLYFVAGDDGTTYYSRTLEEHQANTKKYCTKECQ